MLPQAMRVALLPYLGEARDEPEKFSSRMLAAHHWTIAILPVGLIGGPPDLLCRFQNFLIQIMLMQYRFSIYY